MTDQQGLLNKSTLVPIICICMVLAACATVGKPGDKFDTAGWSSSDPLSIPQNIRQSQFDAGNLVANSSFEKGRRAGKLLAARLPFWDCSSRSGPAPVVPLIRWGPH